MLIFDRFGTRQAAEDFAAAVALEHGLDGRVCDSQEESDTHDPFPFVLTPPIVLIDRPGDDPGADNDEAVEVEVIAVVAVFGGSFAGT